MKNAIEMADPWNRTWQCSDLSIFTAGLSFGCTFWVSILFIRVQQILQFILTSFLALFHALHPTFASLIRYEKTPFYNHDVLYKAQSTDCKKVTCHQDNNVLNAYVIIKVKNRSRSIRIDRSTCMPAGKAPPILVFQVRKNARPKPWENVVHRS